MINEYIRKSINDYNLRNLDKTLLVLKGFSPSSIGVFSEEIPHSLGIEKIFKDEYLNISFLKDNLNALLQEIIKISRPRFITYEEFVFLNSKVQLKDFIPSDLNILIINNNLSFNKVLLIEEANQLENLDIENETAEEGILKENFSDGIYSEVLRQGDHLWAQFVDINTEKKYKEIDLINLNSVEESWDRQEIALDINNRTLTYEGSDFYNFLWDITQGKDFNSNELVILTDNHKAYGLLQKQELLAIKTFMNLNNVKVVFGKLPIDTLPNPRIDFSNILKKYWQSNSFRNLNFYEKPDYNRDLVMTDQGRLIEFIVSQVEKSQSNESFRDIFITAPTGSGKSILFEIPAIYLHEKYNYVTIVISPLIALMHDQVEGLEKKGIDIACYINSELSIYQKEEILNKIKNGEKSIVYISPEMLLSYSIEHFIGDRKIGLFVIDESHLVTTWGRDFRVDYWFLGRYITNNRKKTGQVFPMLALTATAVYGGDSDIVFQTVESLNMKNERIFLGNVRRDNISFDIVHHKELEESNHEEWKTKVTRDFIIKTIGEGNKAIVYCPYKSQIRDLSYGFAGDQILSKIGIYHSEVGKEEKQFTVEDFQSGNKKVILATKAFGMGVDISDIKYVYHYAPSGTLADYVQEIGRCARQKDIEGVAKTDFNEKDLKYTKILHGLSAIRQYHARYVLEKLFSIFEENKRQNFLVSVQDFAYIWGNSKDIDNKVKSTLMLLEKDLLNKFNYYVLIVRPKSLFSKGYLCVKEDRADEFEREYGKYIHKISSIQQAERFGGGGSYRSSEAIVRDIGPTYEIDLKLLWENMFQDISFPSLKHEFFNGTLFKGFEENVFTRYKITISIKNDKITTLAKIESIFEVIKEVLSSFGENYFTKEEFQKKLRDKIGDRVLSKRITDLFMSIFSHNPISMYDSNSYQVGAFLQEKSTKDGVRFKVIKNSVQHVISGTVRAIDSLFEGIDLNEKESFINTKSDISSDWTMKGAFILEAFKLGNYMLEGGKEPQVFIRINYPTAIRRLAENSEKYTNGLIQDIEKRHAISVDIVQDFLSEDLNTDEKWTFIEDYFLGKK